MERYVDVRPWLFWGERWSDQAISARVRPGVRPRGPYAVVMKFRGKTDILSLHPTVDEAWARVHELDRRKWKGHVYPGLRYEVGKIA